MKILIAAAPRTGSHAFAEIQSVENNLSEIMNIEDMLLPRLDDDTIDFSICSSEFLFALEQQQFKKAWELRPSYTPGFHHFLSYDDNLSKIKLYSQPNQYEFLYEHQRRWTCIQSLSDWCIKLIEYQGTPRHILDEMIQDADVVYVLNRKDKIAQALSMTKSTQTQLWHGTIDNPIIADAGLIDYSQFAKDCRTIRDNDKWLSSTFFDHNIKKVYYENLNLIDSSYVKNNIKLIYDVKKCEEYWNMSDKDIDTWFKDFISNYNWQPLYDLKPNDGYFKSITDPTVNNLTYWDLHIAALKAIGIDIKDRDINWLDIGVWFGIMPFVMKEYGFKNIETTDCAVHRIGNDEYFSKLWETFGITPRELEIRPNKRFDLGKTYDLITITKSNVFWKTEEVIHWDGQNMGIAWQNQGADGKSHTYFSVYNKDEWEFFIENLKEFLNPGGIAIINPEPWVYDKINSCHPARDYLKQYQTDIIATGYPYSNYLIVRK